MKTVYTIHNIQYQGIIGKELFKDLLGVPESSYGTFEYNGNINLMKAGIVTSDAVTTVSPNFAQELKDPYFAFGLEHMFNSLSDQFTGILNGINTEVYDPQTDKLIFDRYSAEDLTGKTADRNELQKMMGLPQDEDVFILAVVSRLVEAKGIDLIRYAAENILSRRVQLIILGTGDWNYENYFTELAQKYPDKLSIRIGFLNDIAHKIYAGADAFLMPSKTEPCGLSQIFSMRYGTVPVVRETGGLKDTVRPYNFYTREGTGFSFANYNAHEMKDAVARALEVYGNKDEWENLIRTCMSQDFSWENSAREYKELYEGKLKRYPLWPSVTSS
jgi:starch synthase